MKDTNLTKLDCSVSRRRFLETSGKFSLGAVASTYLLSSAPVSAMSGNMWLPFVEIVKFVEFQLGVFELADKLKKLFPIGSLLSYDDYKKVKTINAFKYEETNNFYYFEKSQSIQGAPSSPVPAMKINNIASPAFFQTHPEKNYYSLVTGVYGKVFEIHKRVLQYLLEKQNCSIYVSSDSEVSHCKLCLEKYKQKNGLVFADPEKAALVIQEFSASVKNLNNDVTDFPIGEIYANKYYQLLHTNEHSKGLYTHCDPAYNFDSPPNKLNDKCLGGK